MYTKYKSSVEDILEIVNSCFHTRKVAKLIGHVFGKYIYSIMVILCLGFSVTYSDLPVWKVVAFDSCYHMFFKIKRFLGPPSPIIKAGKILQHFPFSRKAPKYPLMIVSKLSDNKVRNFLKMLYHSPLFNITQEFIYQNKNILKAASQLWALGGEGVWKIYFSSNSETMILWRFRVFIW